MVKPVAKVKVGDLMTAEKMNGIIERINELEKRLAKLEGKAPARKVPEKKTPKVKKSKTKIPKVAATKKRTQKRKSKKTEPFHLIDLIK
jgi:hypothetical protein